MASRTTTGGGKALRPLVPVTVLSGFLGAGKTTLLQHILSNKEGLRIGMIVNDMSEVNVDAALIEGGSAGLVRLEDKVVELSNGCICCTLREDLLKVMIRLASEKRFDYLVIESSGISEPQPVAETFTFVDEETGQSLADVARLDTCVTVVDAYNWLRDYTSPDSLSERRLAAFSGDERAVVDLLIDQVEFADVLVLNKTDMVSPSDLGRLRGILAKLNPRAQLVESSFSRVPLASVLNTGLFDLEAAASSPGWLQELRGAHTPETLEYGISSTVYRASKPFHPQRLHELLCRSGASVEAPLGSMAEAAAAPASGGDAPVGDGVTPSPAPPSSSLSRVLRSKGFFWIAVDGGMDETGMWSHAGRVWQFTAGRPWWATVPKQEWPPGLSDFLLGGGRKDNGGTNQPPPWDKKYGDRGTELVFIGVGLDAGAVKAELDACLVTEEEFALGPSGTDESANEGMGNGWGAWEDPFDFYEYEEEEGEEGEDGGSLHPDEDGAIDVEEGELERGREAAAHGGPAARLVAAVGGGRGAHAGHSHGEGEECHVGAGGGGEQHAAPRDGPKIARLVVTR